MAKVCLSFGASCYDHFDVCVFVDVSVALDKCVLLVCVWPSEYDWVRVCKCVRALLRVSACMYVCVLFYRLSLHYCFFMFSEIMKYKKKHIKIEKK